MDKARIASKEDMKDKYDKMVFDLTQILGKISAEYINTYIDENSNDIEEIRKIHGVLYNTCMNFTGRTLQLLSERCGDEKEQEKFLIVAKRNIIIAIDMAKDMREYDHSE